MKARWLGAIARVRRSVAEQLCCAGVSGLQRQSRTSTKWPAIAAAAAIAGDTKWVRPLKPWRPSKLRFEVEAQRSSGASLSGFMARHIEQPGSRHSKPALMKILSRPSASACSLTMPEPGTTIALT